MPRPRTSSEIPFYVTSLGSSVSGDLSLALGPFSFGASVRSFLMVPKEVRPRDVNMVASPFVLGVAFVTPASSVCLHSAPSDRGAYR